MENKRMWSRSLTESRSTFFSRSEDITGLMSLNNYSRNGLSASLNKFIKPGSDLLIELNHPRYNIPIWTTGRVIWTKIREKNVASRIDAGIELKEIDLLNIELLRDETYQDKYLEKSAYYAYEVGLNARKNKCSFIGTSYSLPATFIIFFFAASPLALINSFFAFSYALTIFTYNFFLLRKRKKIIFDYKFTWSSLIDKKVLLRIAGIVLNDLCGGLYFIIGYLRGAKKSE